MFYANPRCLIAQANFKIAFLSNRIDYTPRTGKKQNTLVCFVFLLALPELKRHFSPLESPGALTPGWAVRNYIPLSPGCAVLHLPCVLCFKIMGMVKNFIVSFGSRPPTFGYLGSKSGATFG